jgi:hypothetical protein
LNTGATSKADEIEHWNRIASQVQVACGVVERDGTAILIKFDGGRDNGRIYTVIIDVPDGEYPNTRVNSSNLEDALSRVLGVGISGSTFSAKDFAEALRSFDLLAKRGFVVGLRILRGVAHVEFEVFLLRVDKSLEPMERRGPVFSEVAAQIIEHAGQGL